jgi:hypothetical protein
MWSILNIFKEKSTDIIDKIGMSSHFVLIIFNLIYFSALFGIVFINSTYIDIFNIIVHSFLCLFLMYRFNPLRKNIELKHYDQVIIFSSAFFLLLNLGVVEFVKTGFSNGENILNKLKTNTKSSS